MSNIYSSVAKDNYVIDECTSRLSISSWLTIIDVETGESVLYSGDAYVYAILDPRKTYIGLSGEPFYIGKGKKYKHGIFRYEEHFRIGKKHKTSNQEKIKRIKEILDDGYKPAVYIVSNGLCDKAAIDLEETLISYYGRSRDGGILTNIAKRGNPKTETKQKDRRHTEETKEKLRKTNTGKKASKETRQKMSISHQGKNGPNSLKWKVTTPDGKVYRMVGLKHWCRKYNYNYYFVLNSLHGFKTKRYGKGKGGNFKGIQGKRKGKENVNR